MSRLKRILMSNLPLEQTPISYESLFDKVSSDMSQFGDLIDNSDFYRALFDLKEEQALVFFDGKKHSNVIATQYGFRIYGTE